VTPHKWSLAQRYFPLKESFIDKLESTVVWQSFWNFIIERHSIYLKRILGEPPPWTDDPIFQQYKFTNVFRACDRESQYLIKEVIYNPAYPTDCEEIVFRVLLFKLFNKIEAWEVLTKVFGVPTWKEFNQDAYAKALGDAWNKGKGVDIWNRAYVQNQNVFQEYKYKHERYLALVKHMMDDQLPARLIAPPTYEGVCRLLQSYPLHKKGFISMQHLTDLNYSPVIDFDENDFIVPGPGCLNGMRKCFQNLFAKEPKIREAQTLLYYLVEQQDVFFEKVKCEPVTLFSRKLTCIDFQNVFCETDKYARVAHREYNLPNDRGTGMSNKIKQTFTPTGPLPKPFFPPKWGLKVVL
jgi:hypothetical protein